MPIAVNQADRHYRICESPVATTGVRRVAHAAGFVFASPMVNAMATPTPTPTRWLQGSMPITRSPADMLCLALYTLARGKIMRGFMVSTIADWLDIDFYRATEMAEAAHATGLVRHEHGTVMLTGAGQERGTTLTPPEVKELAVRRRSAKRPGLRAIPRLRRPAGKP